MTGFSADWLQLREPFDAAARAAAAEVVAFATTREPGAAPWRIVDLACGSGANLRALAPQLGLKQQWRLVDHDPALLAAVPEALERWAAQHGHQLALDGDRALHGTIHLAGRGWSANVARQRLDLARTLATLALPRGGLVTSSALLDLVSAPWLQALLARAAAARATLLCALSVDGRIAWEPTDPADETVQALFAQHQHGDKGFGAALGPQAAAQALQWMAAAGWRTRQAPTDWQIDGARAPALLRALIDGTAAAALEQDPAAAGTVRAWSQRRIECLPATRLRIGHLDIAGIPPHR
ncbi:SAM-dependent methyltransferase [Aquincola sp. S2]|uniref:SAM-dependent methyltransferase n=1 Tax=Pseudaquabacterium terrae TaxID=2732868 RepID=A0ABX2EC78_9BURK|nr:SAM-dependent methyltransferase [Aquabacterium terrae]NRF65372.1 SAM-dependent methyltransferase [Aquabacterium terrae]